MGEAAPDPLSLAARIRAGDRTALAQAITLIESTRDDHRTAAEALLQALLPHTGKALRLGVTGAPGVGKSTFIEAYGMASLAAGFRVAVLAVDPSSKKAGGSILGDKIRMGDLAREKHAFIRPSPAGSMLGGVARRTREAAWLCEAAGFDRVIVETVGVGQSETAVADLVDLCLLMIAPGGGDDLQGIKRGIVEIADLLVVNKADGDLAPAAQRAVADYGHALRLLRSAAGDAGVFAVSALERRGIEELRQAVEARALARDNSGAVAARRRAQAREALWSELGEGLLEMLRQSRSVRELLPDLEAQVAGAKLTPSAAARRALQAFAGARPA
ncbi:MAG TPA: methylmalonyl Co-A mutase-associated GTPase MeaB [Stellaceae bacterium]|nr:methylmalonyl Co-A mutase-associated GTPase MeaB [Stellaceae bacterium]